LSRQSSEARQAVKKYALRACEKASSQAPFLAEAPRALHRLGDLKPPAAAAALFSALLLATRAEATPNGVSLGACTRADSAAYDDDGLSRVS